MKKSTLSLLIKLAESVDLQNAWREDAQAVARNYDVDSEQFDMILSMKWGSSSIAGPGSPA